MEHPATGTRVTVTIGEGVRSTTLRFLAHARVPSEGAWRIPAFRPLDATWTGGRTTVILDPLHAVSECRERAGRLVPPGRGDPDAADRLVFEAESSRSVADLVFIRPRAGSGLHGPRAPRSWAARRPDSSAAWTGRCRRGSVSQLEIDLSPAWLPDQVRIQDLDDPLAWHSSTLPSGATRLRVMLPVSVLASGPMGADHRRDLRRRRRHGPRWSCRACAPSGPRSRTRRGWRGATTAR